QLRERLPELERLQATAYYYLFVEYTSEKVIATYRQILDTWPDDLSALNNLAIELNTRNRFSEAEETAMRGIAVSPRVAVLWVNAVDAMLMQGKFARADSVYAAWG